MSGLEPFFYFPFAVMAIAIPLGYILTLQAAFKKVQPENRRLRPASVWLLLIPVVNVFWHFYVVWALARSLRKEYRSRDISNDQGTYGLEPGIVVFLINLFLIGLVVIARLQHAAEGNSATGELAVAIGVGAILTEGACLCAHWIIIAIVSGELRSQ
jgi:hypothetical protein